MLLPCHEIIPCVAAVTDWEARQLTEDPRAIGLMPALCSTTLPGRDVIVN